MDNQEPNVLDERVLRDYVTPNLMGFRSPIAPPAVAAHQFDLKPALINMVTANAFTGLGNPNTHLASFLELCDTFKINNVPKEAIYLRLFPFSLMGKAKDWLWSHAPGTFTTWEDLAQAFLLQYFPPGKTAKLRSLINTFAQRDGETFYEAWERYKELQRSCPHHNLDKWTLIHNFYGGMDSEARNQMDQATGGAIMDLLPIDGEKIIEKIARNSHLWGSERSYPKKHGGTHNVNAVESNEEVRAISKKLDALVSSFSALQMGQAQQQQPQVVCSTCSSSSHVEDSCPYGLPNNEPQNVEDVNYMGRNQGGAYGSNFNNAHPQNNQNHPNFSYKTQEPIPFNKNNPPPGFVPKPQFQQGQSSQGQQKTQYQPRANYQGYQQQGNYQGMSPQQPQVPPQQGAQDQSIATVLANIMAN
ncbi:unnamed protein product [Rhodiola kirilowii]